VSDIDTAVVDSLKVLDPKRPIREADIAGFWREMARSLMTRNGQNKEKIKFSVWSISGIRCDRHWAKSTVSLYIGRRIACLRAAHKTAMYRSRRF
jgi:hypothetical protein